MEPNEINDAIAHIKINYVPDHPMLIKVVVNGVGITIEVSADQLIKMLDNERQVRNARKFAMVVPYVSDYFAR